MFKISLGRTCRRQLRQNAPRYFAESAEKNFASMQKRLILHSWKMALERQDSLALPLVIGGRHARQLRPLVMSFVKEPAAKIIAGPDIISASLVNNYQARCNPGFDILMKNSHINLELSVPVQNILGTHTEDSQFHTRLHREMQLMDGREQNYLLADLLLNKSSDSENGKAFNELIHFDKFKRQAPAYRWSSILIATKPHVLIYPEMPATSTVKVKAIHYFPTNLTGWQRCTRLENEFSDHAHMLRRLMLLNNIYHFTFGLARLRRRFDSINYLHQYLVSEFGEPGGADGSHFGLYGG